MKLRCLCKLAPIFLVSAVASFNTQGAGYQPPGTAKSGEEGLIHDFNSHLASAFKGQFALSIWGTHPELGFEYNTVNYGDGMGMDTGMAFGPDGSTLYVSGATGNFNGVGGLSEGGGSIDSIAEIRIPSLIKRDDVNDRSGFSEPTLVQDWTAVFKESNGLTDSKGFHSITGLYHDKMTDKLCVLGVIEFDGYPYTRDNMVCYRDSQDLAGGGVDGFIQVKTRDGGLLPEAEAAHLASWMTDVPIAWRSALGGRILWGGGQNGSILARHVAGVSLFAGNMHYDFLEDSLVVNRHLDYWDVDGYQMGSVFFPERLGRSEGSWYQFELMNCDRDKSTYVCGAELTQSEQVVPWINDWFNILTYGHEGFIIPGTRTYAVIGTIHGVEDGISYKGNPEYINGGSIGGPTHCTGPCTVTKNDKNNKYWLFDLDDILAAENPWEVFPYEHGNLDFLDQFVQMDGTRSIMRNATFDLNTGKLAIAMNHRFGGGTPLADIAIFEFPGWSETVEFKALPNSPGGIVVRERD